MGKPSRGVGEGLGLEGATQGERGSSGQGGLVELGNIVQSN